MPLEQLQILRPPQGLMALAKNPLERAAALVIEKVRPDILAASHGQKQRQLLFCAFLVPIFCGIVISRYQNNCEAPYWLWQHGTYILALERMILEMYSRQSSDPPKSLMDFLINQPEPSQYWLTRFNQWRQAAAKSYRYFIGKNSPAIKKSASPRAAHLGTLQNLTGPLPDSLFQKMLYDIRFQPIAVQIFNKTAQNITPARWGEPEIDTWIIEIWPLVTKYSWNYVDIWRVINTKFDHATENVSFDRVDYLEDRCKKMLNLKLSPRGQAKQGRPKQTDDPPLPMLASLAIWIKPIAAQKKAWICGQFFGSSE